MVVVVVVAVMTVVVMVVVVVVVLAAHRLPSELTAHGRVLERVHGVSLPNRTAKSVAS